MLSFQLPIIRGAVNPRDLDRLTGRHFISKIVQKEGQKSKLLRTCPVCNVPTGKRRTPGDARKVVRSKYECKDCDVGLCVDPCFRIFLPQEDGKFQKSNPKIVWSLIVHCFFIFTKCKIF
jgi:hypothetical protein